MIRHKCINNQANDKPRTIPQALRRRQCDPRRSGPADCRADHAPMLREDYPRMARRLGEKQFQAMPGLGNPRARNKAQSIKKNLDTIGTSA